MASPRSAAFVIGATAAVLACGLAAIANLVQDPAKTSSEQRAVPIYTVETARLSVTFTAAGSMQWKPTQVLAPGIDSGTLTSTTLAPARSVAEGEVVFSIDQQPVVAIESPSPFFRDLGAGTAGADVDALLGFLERHHFLHSASSQRGMYTKRVVTAVQAWQTKLHQPKTGIVAKRSIAAIAHLPALLGTSAPVGSVLSGDPVISQWLDNPTFEVTIGGDLRDQVAAGTTATVHVDEQSYPAKVAGLSLDDAQEGAIASESVVAHLVRADGQRGPLCGTQCEIPADKTSTVTSVDLVLLAPVTGPAIPSAAVGIDAAGSPYVVRAGRPTRVPVKILAEADGRVVVSGLRAGTKVLALTPP